MKTVSKKLLSLLLVVLLLAAAVPFQAFADEFNDGGETIEGGIEPQDDGTDVKGGTPYTVKITVFEGATNKGEKDLAATTENPPTKTQVDAAVAEVLTGKYPNGYTITGYKDTAGSPLLTDADVLPDSVKALTVTVKDNTPPAPADYITLTLNAGAGATIGSSGSSTAITINKNADGKYVTPTLPNASKSGYTFKGWFRGDDRLEAGTELTVDTTATAKFELITNNIKVKGVKTTQKLENAWLICEFNAEPNRNLLDFLKANAADSVAANTPAGYQLVTKGGSTQWFNFQGSATLTGQEQITATPQEVVVKYEPKTFTLYFQVDGGSVNPTSKSVTFDMAVGTLPTPTRSGDVFLGWFDANGTQYTSETVYKVNGDTTLTARWQSESSVLLRIYLDPNTTTPDRIVDITGKVVGNSVSRSEVEAIVTKYYSGSNMKLVGLFSDELWKSYKAGTTTAGTPNVSIQEDSKTTNVHVVVKNATNKPNSSNPTTSTTKPTTKPADPDNPKTGDSMMIYTASAVMLLAAATLITIQVLRKKRTF